MLAAERRSIVARFDGFELDVLAGELHARDNVVIRLPEQSLLILVTLLERPGQVVARDEIRNALWPQDTVVEFEHSISAAMNRLRQALGDSADTPKYIETLARRGYRWMVAVEWAEPRPRHAVEGNASPEKRGADGASPGEPGDDRVEQDQHRHSARRYAAMLIGAGGLATLLLVNVISCFSRPGTPLPQLTQRQLTTNSGENPVGGGAISPDGTYLAYSDGTGIHFTLLATGERRDIAERGTLTHHHVDWQLGWYPDSTRLIATASVLGQRDSIWTVSVLGGELRELRHDASSGRISPDGTSVAYTTRPGRAGDREIWVMGADGQGARKLAETDERSAFSCLEWSPDSRRLANIRDSDSAGVDSVLESRDLIGHPPTTVKSGGALAKLRDFKWLPDGRLVYLMSEPDINLFTCNYWAQHIDAKTGQPRDDVIALTHWAGFCMDDTSATADGRKLVFKRWRVERALYVADLESGVGRITTPTRLTHSEGNEIPAGWTLDSRSVIFVSNRAGSWGLYRQVVGEDTAEPLAIGLSGVVAGISPDGKWLLYGHSSKQPASPGLQELSRVRIEGRGQPELVLSGQFRGPRCASAPSPGCVVSERTSDRKHIVFTSVDALKGRGRAVASVDANPNVNYAWDLSADGTRIAVLEFGGHRIHVLSSSGDRAADIDVSGWTSLENLRWNAFGTGFFAASRTPETSVLLSIDLQGHSRVLWEQKGTMGNESAGTIVVPSPDGRRLAMMEFTLNANMWMMEHF